VLLTIYAKELAIIYAGFFIFYPISYIESVEYQNDYVILNDRRE
jgi:hypothetical protein